MDNIDWPSKKGLSTELQQAELIRILDRTANLKLNTVVLQMRPAADALYASKLEPWSEYLTGKQGQPPSPYYDPLEFATTEAHKRGLDLHVWFNPYRAKHPSATGPLASSHLANTHPSVVKSYGKLLWMDPGEPFVQKRTLEVIADVVKRYDIDGVHIDDYFYPYPEKGVDFPDEPSFRKHGKGKSRDDWRRQNVDHVVEQIYKTVHRIKPHVQFGISPFGIYRPQVPPSISAGIDQYAQLYADPLKWLQKGWCDYMAPQLYWPIAQKAQSYPVLLDWWIEVNSAKRHIWPGLFTSRVLGESKPVYTAKEVVDQIELTRTRPGSTGHIHFSMKALMQNSAGVSDAVRGKVYQRDALIPASPWLSKKLPKPPVVELGANVGEAILRGSAWRWLVWTRYGSRVSIRVLPGKISHVKVDASQVSGALTGFAVAAVDRFGNQSEILDIPVSR